MDCPRCEAPLERYVMTGRETLGCERCGYVGVPVEHASERREAESWEAAIERFRAE
jgi:uncharacterized Zn finger protein (UPF0148 family)